jgi:hypothetical protein
VHGKNDERFTQTRLQNVGAGLDPIPSRHVDVRYYGVRPHPGDSVDERVPVLHCGQHLEVAGEKMVKLIQDVLVIVGQHHPISLTPGVRPGFAGSGGRLVTDHLSKFFTLRPAGGIRKITGKAYAFRDLYASQCQPFDGQTVSFTGEHPARTGKPVFRDKYGFVRRQNCCTMQDASAILPWLAADRPSQQRQFFEGIMQDKSGAPGPQAAKSQQQTETAIRAEEERRRMRAIENALLIEYDAARAEFDRAKENPEMVNEVKSACELYIRALRRLYKFLAEGEVPPDLGEKSP